MIRFIVADLRRLWLGSAVIMLIVALATALGVAVTLQERALRLGSARAADRFDLVIGAPGSETQLILSSVFLQAAPLPLIPGAVLAKLAADPRVAWAAPVGFGDSSFGYPIVGTTMPLVLAAGALTEGHGFEDHEDAVVGSAVTLAIGAEVKPMHGAVGEGGHVHEGASYHVVGRMPRSGTPWDRAILVPIEAVWHVHGMDEDDHEHGHEHDHAAEAADRGTGDSDHDSGVHAEPVALGGPWSEETPGVPAIIVKPKSIADAYRLRGEYRTAATLAVFPGEVLTRLYSTLGDARRILTAVATGAQALVAAAVALVAIAHVGQRRRQIGALRALGAPRLAVFGIVWGEIFAIVGLGIALGIAIGYGATLILSQMLTAANGVALPVVFEWEDLGRAAILVIAAAVVSALPAIMAYRQPPAAALRD
ncbi:MAG: ABC transporter permease [Bosea sp.]|nr:ABC transporter permease [Bosea sp. (in: a-proteobacteria)]